MIMSIDNSQDGLFSNDTVLKDADIDECEVGRCSCGLVFYSTDYALEHVCLGSAGATEPGQCLEG